MLNEAESQPKFCIIGAEDVVMGFKGLGFNVYTVNKDQQYQPILDDIIKNKIVVCLVEEKNWPAFDAESKGYIKELFPICIPFTGSQVAAKRTLLDGILEEIKLKAIGTV